MVVFFLSAVPSLRTFLKLRRSNFNLSPALKSSVTLYFSKSDDPIYFLEEYTNTNVSHLEPFYYSH